EIDGNGELGAVRWLLSCPIRICQQHPIKFLAAGCPQGKFRSDEEIFDPPLHALAGKNATIEMSVLCDEPAGSIVENAFLILLVEWLEASWRLFVRFRVTIDQQGEPETATELITTKRGGFSGAGWGKKSNGGSRFSYPSKNARLTAQLRPRLRRDHGYGLQFAKDQPRRSRQSFE